MWMWTYRPGSTVARLRMARHSMAFYTNCENKLHNFTNDTNYEIRIMHYELQITNCERRSQRRRRSRRRRDYRYMVDASINVDVDVFVDVDVDVDVDDTCSTSTWMSMWSVNMDIQSQHRRFQNGIDNLLQGVILCKIMQTTNPVQNGFDCSSIYLVDCTRLRSAQQKKSYRVKTQAKTKATMRQWLKLWLT